MSEGQPPRGVRRALGYADLARRGASLRRADPQVRENARFHVARRLGRLRGLPQKVGQLLSLSADDDTAEAFRPLTGSVEPLPLAVIEAALAEAWGCDPATRLAELDEPGLAASLGQVHRARLHDGREVAVKVQYPGVAAAVEQDLQALGWLSVPLGDLRRGFDLAGYRDEIRRDLAEELDYTREAAQQQRFAELCAGEPWLVPAVYPELSTPTVLVSDWVTGDDLQQVRASWSPRARSDMAFELVRLFSRTVLGAGLFHADPHEGNYRFQAAEGGRGQVVLYDFGSTFALSERERLVLLRLVRAGTDPGGDDPLRLLVALGFDAELLAPLAPKLPALLSLLLLPYRQRTQFDLSDWDLGARVGDVLGDDRWNFRIAAPARLLFLMRAWQGLIHQLRALDRPVSWTIPAEPYLARDAQALEALELPRLSTTTSFAQLADHVRVEVTEDGRQKVKVSLPASAVDHLEELIEPETLAKIEAAGVDLEAKKREIRRRAYAPQEVFSLEEDRRVIRVWLD